MVAKCGFCERVIIAREEGELCPHCVEEFSKRLFYAHEPRPFFSDRAAMTCAMILLCTSAVIGYFFG
jgi:hypothetical protein